jgi:hypothetical protein
VLGVEEVAGGGGQDHRGVGGTAGGVRGDDEQINAVTVGAQRGEQVGRLAAEVAQSQYPVVDAQPVGWLSQPSVDRMSSVTGRGRCRWPGSGRAVPRPGRLNGATSRRRAAYAGHRIPFADAVSMAASTRSWVIRSRAWLVSCLSPPTVAVFPAEAGGAQVWVVEVRCGVRKGAMWGCLPGRLSGADGATGDAAG